MLRWTAKWCSSCHSVIDVSADSQSIYGKNAIFGKTRVNILIQCSTTKWCKLTKTHLYSNVIVQYSNYTERTTVYADCATGAGEALAVQWSVVRVRRRNEGRRHDTDCRHVQRWQHTVRHTCHATAVGRRNHGHRLWTIVQGKLISWWSVTAYCLQYCIQFFARERISG